MNTKGARKFRGEAIVLVLLLIPILLWQFGSAKVVEPMSAAYIAGVLGKAAALVSIVAYSLMPILSMRHAFIVRIFGGIDSTYGLHKKIGKIAFYTIWAHPFLLAIKGFLKGKSVGGIWQWDSALIVSGIVAIGIFSAIMVITIYSHIRHQRWISFHRFFGWILPLIFFHAIVANSQIVKNKPLLIYVSIIYGLGMIAFFYRSVFGKLISRYPYVVCEVNTPAAATTEVVLKPIGIPMAYNPGQFAYLSVVCPGIDPEAHPYSFTTAANGPYIRFVIKELGDDTKTMKNLVVGSKAFLEGPYGDFTYHNSRNKKQIWIAGGVGVTPFLSLARSLKNKSAYRVQLFYASDRLEDTVFLRELLMIQKTIPDVFELTVVNKNISGFVSLELLQKQLGDLTGYDFFICGPPPMLKILKGGLVKAHVSSTQVYTEEFSTL